MIRTCDPATGAPLAVYLEHTSTERAAMITAAARAQRGWQEMAVDERGAALHAAAALLTARTDDYAELITREMGKPIAYARAEVSECAAILRRHAGQPPSTPIGPVLAVTSWMNPFQQVLCLSAPELMAGAAVLVQPAPNVTGCALALEQLLTDAGCPAGVFAAVLASESIADDLAADPRISRVVGGDAAAVPVGSCPADDVPDAVAAALRGLAVPHLVVTGPVPGRAIVETVARLRVGDPFDPETDIGPLALPDLVHDLDQQVAGLIAAGARLVTGGRRVDRAGWYYAPTVLVFPDGVAPPAELPPGPVVIIRPGRPGEGRAAR
ncbi:aldehyde dehydrogenase family protein [Actinoplanes subglobosus]|uniref:Aldehyde dehydrogenase family protein n=1 Tax=Actinoplanes subglobosus TaxID=1547892 RepID=A0ABV8IH25_9ACTN